MRDALYKKGGRMFNCQILVVFQPYKRRQHIRSVSVEDWCRRHICTDIFIYKYGRGSSFFFSLMLLVLVYIARIRRSERQGWWKTGGRDRMATLTPPLRRLLYIQSSSRNLNEFKSHAQPAPWCVLDWRQLLLGLPVHRILIHQASSIRTVGLFSFYSLSPVAAE